MFNYYTYKDLVDVLDLNKKTLQDCGIARNDIKQINCDGKVHSFINPSNLELFKSSVIDWSEFEEITENDANVKIVELKEIERVEQEEVYKKTDAYKLKKLEEENASINYILMQNNLL